MIQADALKAGVRAMGGAFDSATGFLKESVAAAAESDEAFAALKSALARAGVDGAGKAAEEFSAFASQLQLTSKFEDDAIVKAMSVGASFGLLGDKLKGATTAAADMATVLGMDMNSAMRMLARAQGGSIAMFSRFGIKISEAEFKAKGFQAVLDALNKKFGGAAQDAAQTYSARMVILGN